MVTLLVSCIALQVVAAKPVWVVGPFDGLFSDRSERLVSDAVTQCLRQSGKIDVPENHWMYGGPMPGELSQAVEKALALPDVTILRGRIFAGRHGGDRSGQSMSVSIKSIAYDAVSGLRVSEATAQAKSSEKDEQGAGSFEDALRLAATRATQATQASMLPSATILNTTQNVPLINRGLKDGYRKNTPVVVVRGRLLVGVAHIGAIESDQAELVFDRTPLDFCPGDHVRPILSPRG